jgi:ACS family hexuronate transporter-like MFS transporter
MPTERSTTWRYGVCTLLLCASMLLYMDRLTLSLLGKRIVDEYGFSKEEFGTLDTGLSYAFAGGALFFGFIVDRVGPRWLYPTVLVCWSGAGLATAYSEAIGAWILPNRSLPDQAYCGFMICRVALGFFESGHWPCALVTTQAIMARGDRSLGNSILQSGSAVGSIITPHIVGALRTPDPGGWQPPFTAIGLIGMFWIVPWFLMIRRGDIERHPSSADTPARADDAPPLARGDLIRMFGVLTVIVICINLTWQFFRVWLPIFLQEAHGYTEDDVKWFTSAYYISAEVGCIAIGLLVKWLITNGTEVHRARVATFTLAAILTSLAMIVAFMPTGPLLSITLVIVAAGTLGLYPNYYSFSQELTRRHQGKISGALGTIAWIGSGTMQKLVGRNIDETQSYATGVAFAGFLPVVACIVLWLCWPRREDWRASERKPDVL